MPVFPKLESQRQKDYQNFKIYTTSSQVATSKTLSQNQGEKNLITISCHSVTLYI